MRKLSRVTKSRLRRVTGAQAPEGLTDLDDALALTKDAVGAVRRDVVKAQEMLSPMRAAMGGAHASGPALPGPGDATPGPRFQRLPLIKTHGRRPRGTTPIEPPDAFLSVERPIGGQQLRLGPGERAGEGSPKKSDRSEEPHREKWGPPYPSRPSATPRRGAEGQRRCRWVSSACRGSRPAPSSSCPGRP